MNGPLGAPVGEEQAADVSWHWRQFQHGAIYWRVRTAPQQVWEVHDPIWPLYQSLGVHESILGFPESDQNVCRTGSASSIIFRAAVSTGLPTLAS